MNGAVRTCFGLDEREVRELVTAVTPRGGSPEAWRERFARATWTTLAEPGDATAGALIADLGPIGALDLVLDYACGEQSVGELALQGAARGTGETVEPELEKGLARWLPRLSARQVVRSLEQARRFGIACTTPEDPWWPSQLSDLGRSTATAMWVRGLASHLDRIERGVALVGARAATGYGEHVTTEIAAGLVDRQVAIVSGGAYGVDGVGHRTALAVGGLTVAVLAGGLDRLYPSGHESLLTRVSESGLLVSEVPCGVPPTKFRFLNRNRLIAALTGATVVVEAGWRSGSLNTAGHAAAMGRPLGAVPGPVTSAASAGCHRLLREFDATCITSAAEVMELLGASDTANAADGTGAPDGKSPSVGAVDGRTTRVMDALSARSGRGAGDIAARAGLSVASTLAELASLATVDLAQQTNDGTWRKV